LLLPLLIFIGRAVVLGVEYTGYDPSFLLFVFCHNVTPNILMWQNYQG
jgi:hypothetical protein